MGQSRKRERERGKGVEGSKVVRLLPLEEKRKVSAHAFKLHFQSVERRLLHVIENDIRLLSHPIQSSESVVSRQ